MSTKRRRMRRRNRIKRRIIHIGLFSVLFIIIFSVASKIFTGKDQSAGIEEVIIPHDSYHESQIIIPAIRGNRTSNTLFSSACKVATV